MTTKTLPDSTTAAYYYNGSGVTLVNTGTQGKPGASGINFGFVVGGNNDTLINNGTVFGQRVGVYVTGSGDSVTNAAGKSIIATEALQGGVNFYNFIGTVTNYGIISGYANATNGNGGNAVELRHGGLVTNFGTLLNGGALFRLAPGTLVNSGVVLGNAAYGGVYMQAGGTVTNRAGGLISANGATSSYLGAPPYGVFIVGGASTITNAGTIDGNTGNAVLLPTGFQNRVIVDPGAVFVGTVNGGTAVDATLELASSASVGTLSGFGTQIVNFGTVNFDPSASWLLHASTAISSAVINGFTVTDTIDLAGFVAVSDTFAANTLVLTNASNVHVTLHIQGALTTSNFTLAGDGGGGTDLGFTAVAPTLNYGQTIDEAGIVATSETVSAGTLTLFNAGGTAVGTVAVGTSLASGNFSLRSDGSGGTDVIVDTVFGTYTSGVTLLTNPTTIASTGKVTNAAASGNAVSGPAGTNWTLTNLGTVAESGATAPVGISLAASGTVINSGSISATTTASNGVGVSLAAGGVVTNQSGGAISGPLGIQVAGASGTVVNAGIITGNTAAVSRSGVKLSAGGSATNQSGGTISGFYGVWGQTTAISVANQGAIIGNLGSSLGIGVYLAAGGTVINAATASITGGNGVYVRGATGTVQNAGFITGNATNASNAGVYLKMAGSSVTNQSGGTITGFRGVAAIGSTVVNAGNIGGNTASATGAGVLLNTAGVLTNQSGGIITGFLGVYNSSGAATVVNAGYIGGNTSTGKGIVLKGAGTITNMAGGTISGGADAVTFAAGFSNRLVDNPGAVFTGTVDGGNTIGAASISTLELASGASTGTLTGLGSHYVNFAQVVVDTNAQWVLAGANTAVHGVTVTDSGTLTVNGTLVNAGVVTGTTLGVIVGTGGFVSNQAGGTIAATATNGIAIAGSGAGTVRNAGIVQGNTSTGFGVSLASGGSVTNQSGGTIGGAKAVFAQSGALTVVNAGGITGALYGVQLAAGGTIFAQSGGTISGAGTAVSFGAGHTNRLVVYQGAAFTGTVDGGNTIGAGSISTMELASGASAGTLSGLGSQFIHFANVTVDSGAQWTLTGTQTGFAKLTNAGTLGGTSSFGIRVGNSASGVTVTNQTGGLITGSTDAIYIMTGGGAGTVSNSGQITGGTNSFAGINLSGGGGVSNASGGTITGHGVGVFIANGTGATVSNAGSIGASQAYGIWLLSGGTINNASGGRITAGYATADAAGIYLGDGGAVTNQAGGTIGGLRGIYVLSVAGTVVNAGHIAGSDTTIGVGAAETGAGIYMGAGGMVTNQAGGTISGYDGVYLSGATGTVVNAGVIAGIRTAGRGVGVLLTAGGSVTNQSTGTISAYNAIEILGTPGTLLNLGQIVSNGTSGGNNGVYLQDGGTIINGASGGTIVGASGILVGGNTGIVQNAGYINGTSGTGVRLTAGGTVTNRGIVKGSTDAVTFASGFTNRLVVVPGAAFIGIADGGNTIGSASISTLELASAASAGTLSGLGTQFVNFARTAIDSGATWTLSGSNTIVAGATATNAGTFIDSGTLFNAGTFTGNALQLNNGALTNQATGLLTASYVYGVAGGTGTVLNQGTIAGGFGPAIYLKGAGDVTNAAGALISSAQGVRLNGANATVFNQGTIASTQGTAGSAVFFSGGNVRIVESPTATLIGGVYGGVGGTATFELASGSSAGIITGFGASITSFTSLTFDTGAQWTVGGDDSANGLGTLAINGFTLGDTIDLTGFAAVSRIFASNALVLTDSGGAQETLHVQGTFSAAQFHLSSDGSGGTDVSLQQVPTITAGATATFDGGGSPVVLDGNIAVSDPGSAVLTGATIEVNTGFISGDTLNFINTASITGNYTPATGVLTLTGSDTLADYEAALDSITYSFSPSNGDPTGGGGDTSRAITWIVNDATADGTPATSTLNVAHVAPTIAVGGAVTFNIGGSAVTLDGSLTVADVDSGGILAGATVAIGSGFLAGDVLNFVNTGNISGNYNASTGVLTLTGSDGITAYEDALASITYTFAQSDPSNGGVDPTRAITWTINDGSSSNGVSNTGTTGLDVYGPPPAIGGTSSVVAAFIQQGPAVVLDNAVTLTDADSSTLTGATVTISGGLLAGDTLTATTGGTVINARYDSGTGVLTLTGADTLANYQQVLRSLTYSSSAPDPTAGGTDLSRTVTWQLDDGRGSNNLSNIGTTTLAEHVRPTVTAGATVTFGIGGGAILVDPGLTVTDDDVNPIQTATIAITGGLLTGDTLAFGNGTNNETFADFATITASYDSATGVLTFSGSAASATDWRQALASVTYVNAGADPNDGGIDPTRTLSWVLNTSDPNQTSVAASSTVDLAPPPVISGSMAGQTTTDEAAILPFSGVSIGDPNSGQTETVTITLSDPTNGTFTNLGGGTFTNGTYVVSGTTLEVTAALTGLQFAPTPHQVVPGSTVTTDFAIRVTDSTGATSSDSATTVIATAVNDPPTISQTTDNSGVPDGNPSALFGGLTVIDPDVGHTDTVTITMSDPAGGTFSNLSGGSYNAATGVYTLNGAPSAVNAALAALVFTPAPPQGGSYTATTGFSVVVTGPGGTAENNSVTVTTVTQVLGLAGLPTGDVMISVSPDGSSFAPPMDGKSNEAIISSPTPGGVYSLPNGYQAAFLGGSADATLTDSSGGNALLVGNTGNDTISASADGDTLTGGAGNNIFIASGVSDVIRVTGTSNVSTSGSGDTVYAGAAILTLTDSGTGDAIGLSSGQANVTLTGASAAVFAYTGSLNVMDSGTNDAIGTYVGDTAATLAGSGVRVYGGDGTLSVLVTGAASGSAISDGSGNATIADDGTGTTIFGGSGTLTAQVSGTNATLGLAGGSSAVTLSGSAARLYGGSGSLNVMDSGTNDAIGANVGDTAATLAGSGARVYGGNGTLSVLVTGAASGSAVGFGSGNATITDDGTGTTIFGGSGTLTAQVSGTNATLGLDGGSSAVTLSGSAAILYGGSGNLTVDDMGDGDTIGAGTGLTTIQDDGSDLVVAGGGGELQFVGGAGNATIYSGTGSTTVSGGTGALTLYGGAGGEVTYLGGNGPMVYQAGSGDETMNGSSATASMIVNGGLDASGHDLLTAGSGNDSLYAGTGSDTLGGGAGSNQFVFYRDVIANSAPNDVILDFNANDVVYLAGYGSGEAPSALSSAVSSGGATTIMLSDGTHIDFADVGSSAALTGHVISF